MGTLKCENETYLLIRTLPTEGSLHSGTHCKPGIHSSHWKWHISFPCLEVLRNLYDNAKIWFFFLHPTLCFFRLKFLTFFQRLHGKIQEIFTCSVSGIGTLVRGGFHTPHILSTTGDNQPHEAQAGLQLVFQPRMTLNPWSSYPYFLSAKIIGVFHHAQLSDFVNVS